MMFPSLFMTLAVILVMAFAFIRVIGLMIAGDIGGGVGAIVLFVLLMIMGATIWSHSEIVTGVTLVVLLSLMGFYPYAASQLDRLEMTGIDVTALEKTFKNAIERPDNIALRFQIARTVYDLGLQGHAIAIVESTVATLSNQQDQFQNRSLRDVFRGEELTAKQWRRDLRDPLAFREVACPICHHLNPPGQLACLGCGGPFLLELARRLETKRGFIGKLVLAWAIVALFIVSAVISTQVLSGILMWLVFLALISAVGGVFYWLFRPPVLGGRTA